jgi:hypothetical protein
MNTSKPVQRTGQLDRAKVVDSFLVVAYQDGPAFREPCQSSLNNPASWLASAWSLWGVTYVADAAGVTHILVLLHHGITRGIIISLVQAEVLLN